MDVPLLFCIMLWMDQKCLESCELDRNIFGRSSSVDVRLGQGAPVFLLLFHFFLKSGPKTCGSIQDPSSGFWQSECRTHLNIQQTTLKACLCSKCIQ